MTEREAAQKLADLINKIEAAGYQVEISSAVTLRVGGIILKEPCFSDGAWEVE